MKMGKGRRWSAPFLMGKRGRRWGGSTITEVNNTAKSCVVAGEAECGSWRLEVKDDQRKLGQWAECTVGSNCCLVSEKNMAESMR
jgi:hypothetical protein